MKTSIYISYAWGDKSESEEELALQGLCKVLNEHGFEVILDRTHLDYHESLPAFFKVIGEGGIVIPIVGKKYFTRLNCLIEASNMITRGDIKERIFPLVLSDNYDIYNTLMRPKIITDLETFWMGKEAELKKAIDYSNELPGSLILLRQDLNVLKEVIATITPFINYIGTNRQFNFDDELKPNFKTFVEFIIQKTKKEIKKSFYQKIEGEYFGREKDILFIDEFLRDQQKHFLLLFGVGGMGKSHLLSVCLDKFNYERSFFWIRADKNFELRNLFEKCNLRFPKELVEPKKICKQFLDEFTSNNLFLIIDDFYEIIDTDVREMLSDLACLPSGKLLIISRAIPKEIENQKVYHHQILPLERGTFKNAMQSYISTEEKRNFTDGELDKIFDKAQGYPLGGQLIIRLADFGDSIDDILNNIEKFEAQLDEEGKRFSERLLDNIFKKGKPEEIKLLTEFSALLGFPLIDEIRYLLSFKLENLNTLVNRRKFISKDETGRYSAHAMIRDYSYEKLTDKEIIHERMGRYFENKLNGKNEIDWEIVESAIHHFKKVGKRELDFFGQRMFVQFRSQDVKSIIEQSPKNIIRNNNNLIEVYPNYMPYYIELGMAFRNSSQKQQAINTFLKAIVVDPEYLPSYNELGITYRDNNQKQLAINTFLKLLKIKPTDGKALNELGITYRENNQKQLAINTFLKRLELDPKNVHSLNELGITYRENNQKQLAINTFRKRLELDPKNVHSLNELGITYRENNQKQLAINTFRKRLELDPKNVHSLNELGITYRENNQIQLAIDTFLRRLELEPNDVRSLNELGITYRENNQIQQAIDTFLKAIEINPKHLPCYNELGICYRENYEYEKAIEICNRALIINPKNYHILLNLLQIYLFFQPNKSRAKEFYDRLNMPAQSVTFQSNKKSFQLLIDNLEGICNMKVSDFKIYDRYSFFAIQCKAYQIILPLLFKLNEKFPNNSKIASRLGKTLSNQKISRNDEGCKFLKLAISLFKNESKVKEMQEHLVFYFYNLLSNDKSKFLSEEINSYYVDIEQNSPYLIFTSNYFQKLGKPEEEIIKIYKEAINIAKTTEEKIRAIESLLRYLSTLEREKHKVLFEEMINRIAELVNK